MKIGNYFAHLKLVNLAKGEFSFGIYTCESVDSEEREYNSLNFGLIFVEFSIFSKT